MVLCRVKKRRKRKTSLRSRLERDLAQSHDLAMTCCEDLADLEPEEQQKRIKSLPEKRS